MPGLSFSQTLTGAGSAQMSGTRVYFVAWEVTVFGPSARQPTVWDPEVWIGIGHYELGNDLTPGGVISGIGYGKANWIDTPIGQRVVSPAEDASGFTREIAEYIRWSIAPGSEVNLYVFGDT